MFEQFVQGVPPTILQLVAATLLGLFLGLEREWSEKPAGIRTFALIALVGCIFGILDSELVIAMGVLLVVALALLLGYRSIKDKDFSGLALTTSVSMLVTYGVGVLVGLGFYFEGVTIAILAALLLVLKRELHEFALNLSKKEIQSAAEFAVIAFVIYPLLPAEPFGPWDAIDARLVWLLVIAISGIGFLNYILVREYEEKGFWATGFFGGLVNSTAVVVSITNRVGEFKGSRKTAISTILLANSAMAVRNTVIAVLFVPALLVDITIPLGIIAMAGVLLAYKTNPLGRAVGPAELKSPFSIKNALMFGGFFLIVLLISAWANVAFGDSGFLVAMFIAGLVSSGSATTTAVALFGTGQIGGEMAALGVIVGTIASIMVKIVFAGINAREITLKVLLLNLLLISIGLFGVALVLGV
ncbi:MgtC/SapB family protein [Methanonatronarchaeum sp. AMET6-2]|uniref:MgtC/SapB family protein n=1 Tax=Methanonatronarchaeum sp. AMET6-2 TaxID=2933293 RepID=UPI00121F8793|nr:MgtC/SapB family protein [Methanonatronarchaeum sp. AMET6-2]RZN62316.1 MAG: MgtC/SapB family protein [Methanonatronarchaeia archaeon]UOY09588.1 MgtC/SapB family protein [Methanonatronarchaeum sp. AMET6-2]